VVVDAALNTTSTVAGMASGLIVMPYLILTLGASTYGLWILIGSLTGYFGVFDLGLAASVGRFVARGKANHDMRAINCVLSTGLILLLAVCVIVGLVTVGFTVLFPAFFHLDHSQLHDVKYSILVVGFSVAVMFPLSVFSGLLWGYERFDLQNSVDIPVIVSRALLTLLLIHKDSPILTLACVISFVNLAGALIKMAICFAIEPALRMSHRYISKAQVFELCSFGGWMSLISWSRTLIPQLAPTLIGHVMGTAQVTTYSVAKQLVSYLNSFAITATQVIAPRAIANHATNESEAQRKLYFVGGRFAACLGFFFLTGISILGFQFIHYWQHGLQDSAYVIAVILIVGELLPTSQWVTYSILIGSGWQRALGLIAIAEAFLTMAAAFAVFIKADLLVVATGLALAAFLTRGAIQCFIGCRRMGIPVPTYFRRCIAPSALVALPATIVMGAVVHFAAPTSLTGTLGLGVLFAAIYWTMAMPAIAGRAAAIATCRAFAAKLRTALS